MARQPSRGYGLAGLTRRSCGWSISRSGHSTCRGLAMSESRMVLDRSNVVALAESGHDSPQMIIQGVQRGHRDMRRHASIVRLGNPAGDTRERIGVSAKRDGLSHGVLIVDRFQKGHK